MKKTAISLIVTCLATSCLIAQTGGGAANVVAGSGPNTAGPSTPATPAIPGSRSTDPGQSGIGTSRTGVDSRDLKNNPRVSTGGSESESVSAAGQGQLRSGTNSISGSGPAGTTATDSKGIGTIGTDVRGQGATKGTSSPIDSRTVRPINSSDDWKSSANAGLPSLTGIAGLGTNSINNSSGVGSGLTVGRGALVVGSTNAVASGTNRSGTPITEASGASPKAQSPSSSGGSGTSGTDK